ncbi:MAG: hypothetical protein IJY23_00470 [Clostridia bacterium]|nr:hypothetical protein [Clostridia bacterium]
MKRKLIILIFSTLLVGIIFTLSALAASEEDSGITFTSNDYYQSINNLDSVPLTFEAWVKVSKDAPDGTKIGAIVGTYDGAANGDDSINLEIVENGAPKIYIRPYDSQTGKDGDIQVIFPNVDMRTGSITHLAITLDPANNRAYCYVDGELKETYVGLKYWWDSANNTYAGGKSHNTMDITELADFSVMNNVALGRDHRTGSANAVLNSNYAEVYSVALYSKMLDQNTIAKNMQSEDYTADSLLMAYNLTAEGKERLKDNSSNENHLYYTNLTDSKLNDYYKDSGIRFTNNDYYQSVNTLTSLTLTFEAWVKVSKAPDGTKIGPILGMYDANANGDDAINFEIAENGAPKIYIKPFDENTGKDADAIQVIFPTIDMRDYENIAHLAITLDPANNKAYCYVNGELKETYVGLKYWWDSASNTYAGGKSYNTMDITDLADFSVMNNVALGRDHRTGNSIYTLNSDYAEVYSVALYSEMLDQNTIAKNMHSKDYTSDSLLMAYDLTAEGKERLKDNSSNKNHLYYTNLTDSKLNDYYKDSGIKFTNNDYYQSVNTLDSIPLTFEAWVKVNSSTPDGQEIGPVIGMYDGSSNGDDAINLIIAENGAPKIYIKPYDESSGKDITDIQVIFPTVDMRDYENIAHLAITLDPTNNKAYCYVNGERKATYSGEKYWWNGNAFQESGSTITIASLFDFGVMNNVAIGRDHRTGNSLYKLNSDYAELYSVAIYSEMLDQNTIAKNMQSEDYTSDSLIIAYDLTAEGKERLKDLSLCGNNLCYSNTETTALTEWYGDENSGFDFSAEKLYRNDDIVTDTPLTFEATVFFPRANKINVAGGVIVGNRGYDKRAISFEISSNGAPTLVWVDDDGSTINTFTFDKVSVYTGEETTVTVTIDKDSNKVLCYVNGELEQSIAYQSITFTSCFSAFTIGGDYRKNNKFTFNGKLLSCAVYSSTLTAEQISANLNETETDNLLFAYDYADSVENGAYPERLKDISENGNDAIVPVYFIGDTLDSNFEAAYSFAVVGDTQSVTYYYPDKLSSIYDWILANIDEKNIKFVMGLGDVTEKNSDTEWAAATLQFQKLHGTIPYSVAVGNHDSAAKLTNYLSTIGYGDILSGKFGNDLANTYQFLTVGNVKYLIFTLDCGASDEVLEWASGVISANSDCNVIITTHAYLFRDGTTLDSSDPYNVTAYGYSNDGSDIWDKLVSKHDNIVLVLSGHITSDEIVTAKHVGKNGNVVTELMINPQDYDARYSPLGLVTMLYFSEDGTKVRVESYSTIEKQYFMYENQFETTIDSVETEAPASSFKPLANITLSANIGYNIYVPAVKSLLKFTVDNDEYTDFSELETKIIDGIEYYVIRTSLASGEAARNIKLKVWIKNGNDTVTGTFTFNLAKYAVKVLNGEDEEEKALIMDVLAYVKAAYDYFNGESLSEIDELLSQYSASPTIEGSAEIPNCPALSEITMQLAEDPAMIFYLADGYTKDDFTFKVSGRNVEAKEIISDRGRYLAVTLYAYGMCETIEFTVGGVTYTYHINAYYNFALGENDAKLTNLVLSFWKYCQSARDYKTYVTSKSGGN